MLPATRKSTSMQGRSRRYCLLLIPLLIAANYYLEKSFFVAIEDESKRAKEVDKKLFHEPTAPPKAHSLSNSTSYTPLSFNEWPVPGKPVHIYYIHVGKTGGLTLERKIPIPVKRKQESLDCVIETINASSTTLMEEALNQCNPLRKNETAISRHIVTHYHLTAPYFAKRQKDWLLEHTNTLLYTLRNPIDRIVSAFYFQYNQNYVKKPKPRNHYSKFDVGAMFYLDCFPNASLSTAVEALQATSHPIDNSCRSTAHRAFQGYVTSHTMRSNQRKFPHFLFNYQWYLDRYLRMEKRRPDVLVIRTSHLWADAAAVDRALGGEAAFRQPDTAYTHGSERFRKNTLSWTQQHATTLCCILHRDLQAYQRILSMAVNLGHDEKTQAIRELMETCGMDVEQERGTNVLEFHWETWYQATCVDLLWKQAM